MRKPNFFATLMFFVIFCIGLAIDFAITDGVFGSSTSLSFAALSFATAFIISYSTKELQRERKEKAESNGLSPPQHQEVFRVDDIH
jgi:hypothetical protein